MSQNEKSNYSNLNDKWGLSLYKWKLAEYLGMSKSKFTKMIHSPSCLKKLEDVGYLKEQKQLLPKQIQPILDEYFGEGEVDYRDRDKKIKS